MAKKRRLSDCVGLWGVEYETGTGIGIMIDLMLSIVRAKRLGLMCDKRPYKRNKSCCNNSCNIYTLNRGQRLTG